MTKWQAFSKFTELLLAVAFLVFVCDYLITNSDYAFRWLIVSGLLFLTGREFDREF